jgi:hypothetical protein
MLKGLISAAHCRADCVMNLTGGYDSRLLLAVSEAYWDKTEFFTVKRNDSPHHDLSIPRNLRRRFKLSHRFLDPLSDPKLGHAANKQLDQALQHNVGGMFYDGSIQAVASNCATIGNKLHLPGLVSEVMRCFYYKDGIHPSSLSASELARIAGFAGNQIAEQGFADWYSSLPEALSINALDLLYWEHRLGVWASCGLTYREAMIDQVPPMNCRALLEIGLSTHTRDRQEPYKIIRDLIKMAQPELLSPDFNRDWFDQWAKARRSLPIPWRLKRLLRWV